MSDIVGANGKPIRPPREKGGDFVTRREFEETLAGAVGAGCLAMGQQVYDQVSEQTGEHLERMEAHIRGSILREIEERSLRGRVRTFLRRLRDPGPPELVEIPIDAGGEPDPAVAAPTEREPVVGAIIPVQAVPSHHSDP